MEKKSWLQKYIWCILLLCVVVFGIHFLFVSYTQTPTTATILSVGEITSRHHNRRKGHSSSYTTYHTTLSVRYEEDGEERETEIRYSWRNYWITPKAGQQVQITTGVLGGKKQFPDANLPIYGWIMVLGGGFFLWFAWRIATAEEYDPRASIEPDSRVETSEASDLQTATVALLPDGSYAWSCPVDEAYERDAYRTTLLVCGGICVFLLLVVLIAMPDMETLLIVLGCCAFVMLLAVGIGRVMLLGPGHMRIPYRLTEKEIHIGSGKNSQYVRFRNVRRIEAYGNQIRLHTKFGAPVVFVPQEDYEVIKNYIRQRVHAEQRS